MKCPKRSQIFKAKSTKAAVDFRMSPMVFGNPCKLLNKKIYIYPLVRKCPWKNHLKSLTFFSVAAAEEMYSPFFCFWLKRRNLWLKVDQLYMNVIKYKLWIMLHCVYLRSLLPHCFTDNIDVTVRTWELIDNACVGACLRACVPAYL